MKQNICSALIVCSLIFISSIGVSSGACPVGDLNGDCAVGLADLVVFAGYWLDELNGGSNLDGIGRVDIADLAVLADHWGEVGYRLVINEFMADNEGTIEDPDEIGTYPDWIEIYNYGGTAVDIGGLYLSDDLAISNMWQVPVGSPVETTIPAGGYLVIWADGQPLQGVLHADFKLGAGGEDVGLFDGFGNLIDGRAFGNQNADESYGRFPNGDAAWQKFIAGTSTPGSSNGGESLDAGIVISEIMYHPLHNELAFEPEPILEEYIELLNRGVSAVDVGGWRFVNGVAFTLPGGTTIEAGGYLVVAANVSAFSAKYPGVSNVVGGWVGKLSNKGERVEVVNAVGTVIDSVKYSDQSDWSERLLGPDDHNHRGWMWFDAHDGGGDSLELVCVTMPNEYGQNWKASTTGSGTPDVTNSVDAVQCAPIILDVDHWPEMPGSGDAVSVTAAIIDEAIVGATVTLYWRVDTSVYLISEYPTFDALSYNAVVMFDDGLHGDGQAGDGTYGREIPAQSDGDIVEFFVEAIDGGANARTWPAAVDVDGVKQQVANLLYQVDDSFTADTAWTPGKQPIYYIVMTEAERGRIERIGGGDSDERYSDAQMNATFISVDGVDTKVRYNTGVRNRGEGTRRLPPNNYRVNFRHDDSWKGVGAININSKYTHLQLVGSAIFRMAGLVAADGTGVQVRVNGENLALTDSNPSRMFGTYVHLEAVDSDFAANHFPDDGDGNIYKASVYPQVADLTYLGIDPALYVAKGYSKGTNNSANDWSDLFDLTNVLENEPDETYLAELNRVVNVDQWIRWYAVQFLVGNNETNLGTGYGDDYRMYSGVVDPRFVLVTHDMDTILGDGDNPASVSDSIWRCIATHSAVQMAVIERFLQHPEYVWRYYAELQKVANTVFAAENIDPLLDEVLGGFVSKSRLDQMKQFAADRRADVLAQIPTAFSAGSSLPIVSGYYQTNQPSAVVDGTADATETRAVRVNGQIVNWDGVTGVWSADAGVGLLPGINRLVVQTYGDPDGIGDELEKEHVDVWYDDGNESVTSGTLAVDTVLDAESGPWRVTGSVIVPAGITLTIEAGTTVFFNGSTGITVNGRLDACGSEYARIRLTSVPGGAGWNGVAFSNTDEDNRMCYIDQEYGQDQGESIDVAASRLLIDNMTWEGTSKNIVNMHNPKVTVTNSVIPGMTAESIHVQYVLNDEYLIMAGNIFEEGINGGDIVDIDTSGDGKIFVKFYDNIFYGGGDDGVDLDGTDTYLEGNIFLNFHKNTSRATTSNAVAAGEPYTGASNRSDLWFVRNIFYDNDHAVLLKEEARATMINNVFVKSEFAAIQLWEEGGSAVDGPSLGADIDGCIFKDYANLFNHQFSPDPGQYPDPVITVDQSMLPTELHYLGVGNIDGDPLFVEDGVDFHLKNGSPAIGSGPNSSDMGRYVPEGAFVSGEPGPVTYRTDATLTVGGAGITDYMWRLNDNGVWAGGWSVETGVAVPIVLSGLVDGHTYQVYVQGKNIAEDWVGPANGNASRVWTVDMSYSQLRINEVLARNLMSIEHEATYPDMIELYYDGPSSIDLGGYSLTDNVDLPTKFVFGAGTTLDPGEYMVVYADALATSGIHTGFELTGGGDDLYLYDDSGVLVDSLVFGMQLEGMSVGRIGYDSVWALTQASFGVANIAAAVGDPAGLKINEWLADGRILFGDDWVEIYNPSLWPVDMGGLYMTDDPVGQPDKHLIRALSFVAGEGFGVFEADASLASGHVDFRLSADGEMIGLYDGGLEIDKVIYGPQMTDVSQGRAPNGSDSLVFFELPTPGVSNADVSTVVTVVDLVNIDDVWSYEQSGTDLGTVWRDVAYDDSAWSSGAALLYVEGSSLPAPKNTPLTLGENTYYFRKRFTFNGDPNEIDSLEFATVIDDGAIIYLNGIRVLGIRLGAEVQYSTFADPYVGDAAYEGFSIPADHLLNGDNVIAAEVHQSSVGSSDIVFGLELDTLTTTIIIEDTYADSRAVLEGLRISEIMYNPADDPNSEYIELTNVSGTAINLDGVRFTSGIQFVFPAMMLDPDQYVVAVANTAIFESRYGSQVNVAGEYIGRLSNSGENVVLKLAEPLDAAVMRFEYKDGWYVGTDGGGYSLVINDPYGDPVSWQDSESWRESVVSGGSPGREDVATVIINEVLAHSHAAAPDWIELYNTSDSPVDIGGWYISDDVDDLMKYRIADGTTINAGQYMVFDENVTFGNASDPGSLTQFGLSENGESVYVSSGQGGQLTGYTVEADFGASETGVAFGRYVRSDGSAAFVSMDTDTPGGTNSDPKVGPVVINEIMYNPPVGGSYAAEEYEYIELRNTTDVSVTLDRFDTDLSVTVGWQFTNGIDYVFPLGTAIPANGYLIVAKNPAAFAERYGSANGETVLGPFENATKFSNGGEMVELSLPGDTDLLGVRHYVLVDSVRYDDESPWPATPDGDGDSLARINMGTYGDDVINWQAETVTPGI